MFDELIALLKEAAALESRIVTALHRLKPASMVAEEQGVSPETMQKRAANDAKRRDQISQSTKRISSLRAAMGT